MTRAGDLVHVRAEDATLASDAVHVAPHPDVGQQDPTVGQESADEVGEGAEAPGAVEDGRGARWLRYQCGMRR